MFSDLTVNVLVLRLVALAFLAPVQRLAVAASAVALGDAGPKYDGELKLDPLRHVELFGLLSTIILGIGWSKPVTVDAAQLRLGRAGIVLVILAAFVALLLMALVSRLLATPVVTMLPFSVALTLSGFLNVVGEVALWFALLGLIPIPPLAGGLLLTAFDIRVSPPVQWILAGLLFVAAATGTVRYFLGPAYG